MAKTYKVIALNAFIKKEGTAQAITKACISGNKEKDKQTKPNMCQRKEIVKINLNEMEE